MSEQDPEVREISEPSDPKTIEHTEKGVILGSGQSLNTEPGEGFVAPTMALDAPEADSSAD